VSAVSTGTPVKAALEAEVEAHAERLHRNRLFYDSQEKARKSKQSKTNVRRVESYEEKDDNECFCTEYAEC
jgi:hypothetical protein